MKERGYSMSEFNEFSASKTDASVVAEDNNETVSLSVEKSDSTSSSSAQTQMDRIINAIATEVARGTRTQSDANLVKQETRAILSTVMAINASDTYEVGLVVDGYKYRFDEYYTTTAVGKLVVPSLVAARDVMTARNFNKLDAYAVSMMPLSPGAFMTAHRKVCGALRSNPGFKPITRDTFGTLADAVNYAVVGGKTVNANQDHIVFLTQKFDDEAKDSLTEWIRRIANTLFV
jgi:hypothetical protein